VLFRSGRGGPVEYQRSSSPANASPASSMRDPSSPSREEPAFPQKASQGSGRARASQQETSLSTAFPSIMERLISRKDPLGKMVEYPAFSKFWVQKLQLLSYLPSRAFKELPTLNRREYLGFISEDLSSLLKMPFHVFWSQVAFDSGVQRFLDSFFRFRDRPFDSEGVQTALDDCQGLENEIARRVLMITLRLSCVNESKQDYWKPSDYSKVIQDHGLLGIPRLMDVCSLYSKDNGEVVEEILNNCFDNLTFLQYQSAEYAEKTAAVLKRLYDHVHLKSPALRTRSAPQSAQLLSDFNKKEKSLTDFKPLELLDLHRYLLDIAFTLNSFFTFSPQGAHEFGASSLPNQLIFCYNHTLPIIIASWNSLPIDSEQDLLFQIRNAKIRKLLLSAVDRILDRHYFEPLKILLRKTASNRTANDPRARGKREQPTTRKSTGGDLLDSLFSLLTASFEEESDREKTEDHSFFKDFERHHGITQKLVVLRALVIETYLFQPFSFFSFFFFLFLFLLSIPFSPP